MWSSSVAFDGWATALVTAVLFTVAITIVLRRVERQRAVAVATATARHDLRRNLQWLGYVDWQRRHPDEEPRDHQFGSFDLFPQYAPVLIAERPELAGYLLTFNAWVQYVHGGMIPGYVLADDDVIDITALARALNQGFEFGWDDELLERWASRDYGIR